MFRTFPLPFARPGPRPEAMANGENGADPGGEQVFTMGPQAAPNPGAEGAPFNEPRLAINRVYTRHGDGGRTRLVGGQEVPKDDARIEAYGTVDELNAFVGAARQSLAEALPGAPAGKAEALGKLGE